MSQSQRRRKKRNRAHSISTGSEKSQGGRTQTKRLSQPEPRPSTSRGPATDKTSLPLQAASNSNELTRCSSPFASTNQFSLLNCNQEAMDSSALKPPPIFLKIVNDFQGLINALKTTLGDGTFACKARHSGVAIQTKTSDHYRAVVRYLKEVNVEYFTYQLKEEKAYRVVIRHLHPTTPSDIIKDELAKAGFQVRNVTNVQHPVTKIKLPLFFIDLEPSPTNKNIFQITELYYCKVKIEEPHRKSEIIQCKRCQNYGHSKKYCNYQYRCVKCTGFHATEDCIKKDRSQPATCVLCGGSHPANYRGCEVHTKLQRNLRGPLRINGNRELETGRTTQPNDLNPTNFPNFQTLQPSNQVQDSSIQQNGPAHFSTTVPGMTYAGAAKNSFPLNPSVKPQLPIIIPPPNPSSEIIIIQNTLHSFLNDLKSVIQPLLAALQALSSLTSLLPVSTIPK